MTRDHPWLDGPLPERTTVDTGCALDGCSGISADGVCPNGYGSTCESLFPEPTNMDEDPVRTAYLAARVRELEAENERLRRQVHDLDEAETRESNAVQVLRRDNERLREALQAEEKS